MKIQRIDHVSVNVRDLPAATAFFVDLGLDVLGEGGMAGPWIDGLLGLEGVRTAFVWLGTPDSQASIELVTYHSPADDRAIRQPLANTLGIRHIAFAVEDLEAVVAGLKKRGAELFSEIQQYEDSYKLVYVRGPEGMIIELAEKLD